MELAKPGLRLLSIVNVRRLMVLIEIELGEAERVKVGRSAATLRLSEAVLWVPPFEDKAPLVFECVPTVCLLYTSDAADE